MKKTLILAACAAALALAGCRSAPVEYAAPEKSFKISFTTTDYVFINVWTDPDTGCEMLVTDDGFIQPRMQAAGTQRCHTRPPASVPPAG